MVRTCTVCLVDKPFGDFHKSKSHKYGHVPHCKLCVKVRSKLWYESSDKQKSLENKRVWQDKNRVHVNQYASVYWKTNPDKRHAFVKAYELTKTKHMPICLSKEDRESIKQIYKLSKKLSGLFGVKYHVDHIVPLRGKNVCGLHVPWNLQILESGLNMKKSNSFEG